MDFSNENMIIDKIGFGGSCHWCTEAIFQSLKGIVQVSQGWIKPDNSIAEFSEAVVVEFNTDVISLQTLIEIHLRTHSSTSEHYKREMYQSAVYTFRDEQQNFAEKAIEHLQKDFKGQIITKVLPFGSFKTNSDQYLNYYYSNRERPFCKVHIDPKLKILLGEFSAHIDKGKILHTD